MNSKKRNHKIQQMKIIKTGFITVVFGGFFALLSCNNEPKEPLGIEEKALDSLASLFEIGDHESCIEMGKLITSLYPENPRSWQLLGACYLGMGRDSIADIMFDKVLKLNPDHSGALLNKAVILDRLGQFEKAEVYYLSAIRVNPNFTEAYSNFAGNRLRANDFNRAIEYGETAVELGNHLSDKAILCLSYHMAGRQMERDSLLEQLTFYKYENLPDLLELIEDKDN